MGEKRKPGRKICYTETNLLPKIGVKNTRVSANRVNLVRLPDALENITKSGFANDDKSQRLRGFQRRRTLRKVNEICYTETNLLQKNGVNNTRVSANRVNLVPLPDSLQI